MRRWMGWMRPLGCLVERYASCDKCIPRVRTVFWDILWMRLPRVDCSVLAALLATIHQSSSPGLIFFFGWIGIVSLPLFENCGGGCNMSSIRSIALVSRLPLIVYAKGAYGGIQIISRNLSTFRTHRRWNHFANLPSTPTSNFELWIPLALSASTVSNSLTPALCNPLEGHA